VELRDGGPEGGLGLGGGTVVVRSAIILGTLKGAFLLRCCFALGIRGRGRATDRGAVIDYSGNAFKMIPPRARFMRARFRKKASTRSLGC